LFRRDAEIQHAGRARYPEHCGKRGGSRGLRDAAPCKEHAFVLTNQQMKLIDRFVSRELIVNLLFAIFVLSLVLVVGNIFRKLLPLLVNHDVPVEYLVSFIAYVLPFSLIFTIPWGLLTAILLVFGRCRPITSSSRSAPMV
jgi:hypothetical protein